MNAATLFIRNDNPLLPKIISEFNETAMLLRQKPDWFLDNIKSLPLKIQEKKREEKRRIKVPVILLNYNSSADCTKCVSDLKRQEGVELEIIIVDNCSREDDALAVEQLAKAEGCTFIAAKENRGYNAGNNLGLRYATGRGDRIQKVIFDI